MALNKVHAASVLQQHAREMALEFHRDQVDKAGASYFQHLRRVSDSIMSDYDFDYLDADDKLFVLRCSTVAYLHDILEDTSCTEEYLREHEIPEDIIEGVKSVTRNEGESYGDFVRRAAENKYGRVVKLHDLSDNLDIKRFKKLTQEDFDRLNKYLKWYHYLNDLY